MKKTLIFIITFLTFTVCMARPHGPHGFHGHHHHGGWIAPVMCGMAISHTVHNIVYPTRIWIPGYFQTSYYPNGAPYQVWIPGHWEYR